MGTPKLGRGTKMGRPPGPQASGPGHEAPRRTAILGVNGDYGERAMRARKGLVKVSEPGRLQQPWQRVRTKIQGSGDRPDDSTRTFSWT